MLKHYKDERINKALADMFQVAVKDEEYQDRFECGGDFEILTECIDKTLEYVKDDYQGELRLNTNIWWVCQETLVRILSLFGLRLIGEERVSEAELVVRTDGYRLVKIADCYNSEKVYDTIMLSNKHTTMELQAEINRIKHLKAQEIADNGNDWEIIRTNISNDFDWYEFECIEEYVLI